MRIGAHKKWTTLVVGFVLACQLLTGTGFFCAFKYTQASRALAKSRMVSAVSNASIAGLSEDAWNGSVSERQSVPCGCKKHKKCPTIPRSALTSNPSQRYSEVERHLKGASCDYIAPDLNDYRFALRDGPPSMELGAGTAFPYSTPLAITCILLI
jgi:hypothetical protein